MKPRKANLQDLGALIDFRIAFIESYKGVKPSDSFRQGFIDYFIAHLEWDDFICYIIEEDGIIISGAMLSLFDVLPSPENESGRSGRLFNVFTREAYRHKGYAKAVVCKILAEAKKGEVGEIRLIALEDAIAFYEKLGFSFAEKEMKLIL